MTTNRPSVLLAYTENYKRGGGNRYFIDTVNGLARSFDRVVVASNPGGLFAEDLDRLRADAEVVSMPIVAAAALQGAGTGRRLLGRIVSVTDPIPMRVNRMRFARLARRYGPSAILLQNGGFPAGRSVLAAASAARSIGVPTLLSVVGMPIPRRPRLAGYERAVDCEVWRSVRGVAVSGSLIGRRLIELRDLPQDLVWPHPNCLEAQGAQYAPQPGRLRISMVARVTESKGIFDLIEAFSLVAEQVPEATLRVVGEGDGEEALRSRVRELGLDSRVVMPGFASGDAAVAAEVAASDIYVLPTHAEHAARGEEGGGPPYSILEAMRAGCAIVTTDAGSIRDGVRDGVEGVLVPVGDAHSLAEALLKLARDPCLRQTLGAAARARFMEQFTLDAFEERCAGFARTLMAETRQEA